MLKSKYFWIAMVILVPFIVLWIMEGIGWAIATLGIVALFFLFALGARRRMRRRYYYDDDGYDEEIIVERRPRIQPLSFDRARKNPIRKVPCWNCGGMGKVKEERNLMPIQRGAPGIDRYVVKTCDVCKGRKWLPE